MASLSKPERRTLPRLLAACVGLCAASLVCGCCPALAAAPSPVYQERLDRTVRYLQDAQNADGGFGYEAGVESSPDASAWVALALAAAGINPQAQAREGAPSVYSYLAEHAGELTATIELARALLVVDASGTAPEEFGGVHLVKELLERRLSGAGDEGAFSESAGEPTPSVNDTVFAILALSPIEEPEAQAAVQQAVQWLIDVHNLEGGWPPVTVCADRSQPHNECPSEVDMTGAAIEALNAAGRRETSVQREAFEYLHRTQTANGGFPEYASEHEANVASTAWAVQGMWAAGENPETWRAESGEPSDEPLGYLASMQQEDGHIRYRASEELNGIFMTAEVAPALAGQSLPIPSPPLPASPPPASGGGTEAGAGGEAPQPGGGVLAGGGGTGAPLFSRPQPQSQGSTPGGIRLLGAGHARAPAPRSKSTPVREPKLRHVTAGAASAKPVTITAAPSKADGGHHGTGSGTATSGSGAGSQGSGEEVRGVLIDASAGTHAKALEPGAPGLRSAGAGAGGTQWPAISIGGLIGLLILAGSQLERRRPQVIL